MIEPVRNAFVAGGLTGALFLVGWRPRRGWLALPLLGLAAGAGLALRYSTQDDLRYLPEWTGLTRELGLMVGWSLFSVLARRAGRPRVPGPPALVALVLGALLGELAAASLLAASARDKKAAARLCLAAAGGALLGRLGDPALLILGARASVAWIAPFGLVCLAIARPRKDDLATDEPGSWLLTALLGAAALIAAFPALSPWGLGLAILGAGVLALARPGSGRLPWGEIGWAVGSAGLVLLAVAAGTAELVASSLETAADYLGRLPLPAVTAVSGMLSGLLDAPATSLFCAATLDRALGLRDPGVAVAMGLGAAVGGTGPLVVAGALRAGWRRWLLALCAAVLYSGIVGMWLLPP